MDMLKIDNWKFVKIVRGNLPEMIIKWTDHKRAY